MATPVAAPSESVVISAGWDNKDVLTAWREVENRIEHLAKKEGKTVHKNMTVDDVIKSLEETKDARKEVESKHAGIKTAFNNTLQCINKVGGIVANGASTIFAPAPMCFNAVTFVIKAWQDHEDMIEALSKLLDKCVKFLRRLEIYPSDGVDGVLAKVACQHLHLFVGICDRTIELASKHRRLKMFAKSMFLGDKGDKDIKDMLGQMEKLVDEERGLVLAQLLRLGSESAQLIAETRSGVNLLTENVAQNSREKEMERWDRNIERVLGTQNGKKMDNILIGYNEQRAEGTGNWISSVEQFTRWANPGHTTVPVLLLQGKTGTGKSLMLARIRQQLLATDDANGGTCVAYFSMESDANSAKKDHKPDSVLADMSKSLLWQIASSSESVAKLMSAAAEKASGLAGESPTRWWRELFIENKDRQRLETTFYLLVDLVDSGKDSIFTLLSHMKSDKSIRLLLAASPETAAILVKRFSFPTISIEDHSRADIQKFISSRIDKMHIFEDPSRPGISELRDRIQETLVNNAQGDYLKLGVSLEAISKTDLVADIDEILQNAGKTRSDQITAQINQLNHELTQNQVEEVNLIILWVITARNWLNLEQMDAVLTYKHTGVSGLPSSLLPLKSKMATKYSTLFQVTALRQLVKFKHDGIQPCIPKKARHKPSLDESTKVEEAEINIVAHFINQVCPASLYARFEFDDFFKSKRTAVQKKTISRDQDNEEIKVAITCLEILTGKRSPRMELLYPYSLSYFLNHMKRTDLALADRDLKGQMGLLLIQQFTDPSGIDSLFWTWSAKDELLAKQRASWLGTSEGIDEVLKWWSDSTVTETIESEAAKSLVEAFAMKDASGPDRRKVLLRPAAERLALHLFRSESLEPREIHNAVYFLHKYIPFDSLEKLPVDAGATRTEDPTSTDGQAVEKLTLEELQEIEAWALSALKLEEKDSLWHVRMAYTMQNVCEGDLVEETGLNRVDMALNLDDNNWLAWRYKAATTKDNTESAKILADAILKMEEATTIDGAALPSVKHLLADMLLEWGNRLWDAGHELDMAAETHRKSLEHGQVKYAQYLSVLERYEQGEAWAEVIDFVDKLLPRDPSTVHFDASVFEIDNSKPFFDIVSRAAVATERWTPVENFFMDLIKMAEQQENFDTAFIGGSSFGDVLTARAGVGDEDRVIDLSQKTVDDAMSNISKYKDVSTKHVYGEIVKLTSIYTRRCLLAALDDELCREYVSRMEKLRVACKDQVVYSTPISTSLAMLHARREDTVAARHAVQDLVKVCLDMLSDNDPSNDNFALVLLLAAFAATGDYTQVLAVYDLIAFNYSEKPDFSISFCDGCGAHWTPGDPLYQCKDCAEMDPTILCEECMTKLLNDELSPPRGICNKEHRFLTIPRWDSSRARNGKPGQIWVLLGDELVLFNDWKKQIRSEYLGLGPVYIST